MAAATLPSEYRCVCATLRKTTRAVTQIFDNSLRPIGLRATQFHLLYEIKSGGEATVKELTKRLLLDQTTLTRNLALLEQNGLLQPVPKPDGRVKSVRLTEKGERTFLAARPLWAAAQKEVLGVIGPTAWETLKLQLERLARESTI